jgi:hypothetical protein
MGDDGKIANAVKRRGHDRRALAGVRRTVHPGIKRVTQFTTAATPGNAYRSFANSLMVPVPEPASWSMMFLGFGTVGAALRTSNRQAKTPSCV